MCIRQELASGHCDTILASVATEWGMLRFGRFSHYYENEFAELPGKTKQRTNDARIG